MRRGGEEGLPAGRPEAWPRVAGSSGAGMQLQPPGRAEGLDMGPRGPGA